MAQYSYPNNSLIPSFFRVAKRRRVIRRNLVNTHTKSVFVKQDLDSPISAYVITWYMIVIYESFYAWWRAKEIWAKFVLHNFVTGLLPNIALTSCLSTDTICRLSHWFLSCKSNTSSMNRSMILKGMLSEGSELSSAPTFPIAVTVGVPGFPYKMKLLLRHKGI